MAGVLKGTTGKQLRIDLDQRCSSMEEVDPWKYEKLVGGVGYAAGLLYEELKAGILPLGVENKLLLSTGPLSLNRVPGGGSVYLCFKSPLTGIWGEARCGSDFGPDLKRAGLDHVVLENSSEDPVLIVITDGRVEFKSAAHLKGKRVSEKRAAIRAELGKARYSIFCIGPAGENLVRFAAAFSEDRAAGRTGAGAVMGSKNIMGIAVGGTHRIEPVHPEHFRDVIKKSFTNVRENPMSSAFRDHGTIGDLPGNDDAGDWPTKNWQSNSWGKGAELFDHFEDNNLIGPYACYTGCTIQCGRKVEVRNGAYRTPPHGGAEYESISCFTAYLMNEDMDAAVHCTYLCNEYGMDTISTGSVIAFAMEAYEKGLVSQKDLNGIDLTWGNTGAIPGMIEMIANREAIGAVLAEGVRSAAGEIGGGSERFSIHVKGLEGPAHDARSSKALALSYGTGNRGMCHIQPVEAQVWDSGKMDFGLGPYGLDDPETIDRWDETGKGKMVMLLQDALTLPDILGTCKFFMYAGITVDHLAETLSALTGWEIDGDKLLRVSERTCTIQRLFNIREGITVDDDMLPRRVTSLPRFGKYCNEYACTIRDFGAMLKDYYTARGWDQLSGAPTRKKLEELELSDFDKKIASQY